MSGDRPKVLAVDDRRENLVALQAILEGLAVEVVAVGGGEDALKKLLVDDFAVILLDAHMPGMDGFETAEHIKHRERTRHVPILFLTAVDMRKAFFESKQASLYDDGIQKVKLGLTTLEEVLRVTEAYSTDAVPSAATEIYVKRTGTFQSIGKRYS